MTEHRKENNVDIILEICKEAVSLQLQQKASIETKASALIGFSGVIFALLMGAIDTLQKLPVVNQCLIVLSIVLFAISIIISISITQVRQYRVYPNIITLSTDYIKSSELETKQQLIKNFVNNWKHNNDILERNANSLRWALRFNISAFLILGIALLLSIVTR